MGLLNGLTMAQATKATTSAEATVRLLTEAGDTEGTVRVVALQGTTELGKGQEFKAGETNPATELDLTVPRLAELGMSVCVGEPTGKGEKYIAPRAGQKDPWDAGEWYAELLGDNTELAIQLNELASVGYWNPNPKVPGVLEFRPDATRIAVSQGASKRELLAVFDEKKAQRRERSSSARMRLF